MDFEAKLAELMTINGAIAAALVDSASGMTIATVGEMRDGGDLDLAAAGSSEVMRAQMNVQDLLKLNDPVEDMLITLGEHYQLIRPLTDDSGAGLFAYLLLDRKQANLALARIKLRSVEAELAI
ncbi:MULTISPECIES: hypothetical protein [Novosphingobium]|uniref:Roadblock/LAMTOR2 domain-containing protein n=2 Tax=Novosphingobium TaxID=165696 RepID=A0ABT0AFN6_9SPHN|nr:MULTISPECIES: hypothetical protein [Novosphingobium]MCJ1962026.1 hypothetical protein [Novosphingobium mangrovi (ex Hu et al. 2023)]MED5546267.1 hypothetical protein [Pseudomonadota bacterium]QVM84205.1 hypothetical protein HT578_11360 [Novosphingobium decolorationis]GAM04926.1 hypothetical conserved protein [Novosphingobium sp. MBES04]